MEAQHVHDADRRQTGAVQFRPLRHRRPHQQAAITTALDRQLVTPGVALLDEVLGGGDEVVEDVLLLQLGAGLVPFLTVLAAAAQGSPRA